MGCPTLPKVETPPDLKLGSLVEDHLLGRADYRLELGYPLDFTLGSVIEDAVSTWFLIRENCSFFSLGYVGLFTPQDTTLLTKRELRVWKCLLRGK